MMDLITLNDDNMGAKLVEGYDSLIWTERFNTVGDFQLQTGDVDRFLDVLPEGTILSLRESNVAMVVETHQIDRKKNTAASLLIKGRSFESILDRRVAIAAVAGGGADWTTIVKTPSDAAYYAIKKICVDGMVNPADIFPSDIVNFIEPADYLTGTGPNKQFNITKGSLLAAVLSFLQTEAREDTSTTPVTPAVAQHGIRAIRPETAGPIGVELYVGSDESNNVRFDATRDMLDDGTYLFSKVGSASTAYVLGQGSALTINKGITIPSGMDRRVILVDATGSGIGNPTMLGEEGKSAIADASEIAMMDGTINPDLSDYTYGIHYGLGDKVTLVGDYGLEEVAVVTEYIRSEDATGNKAYPTLVSTTAT